MTTPCTSAPPTKPDGDSTTAPANGQRRQRCAGRAAVGAGPRRSRGRRLGGRRPGRHHRTRGACGTAWLPSLLGCRAPRHAGRRVVGARGAAGPPGGEHQLDPAGLGRRDAAQPRADGDRRAVRHLGGTPPRPDRPRARPRPRQRPAHRLRLAAPDGRSRIRGFRRPGCRARAFPASRFPGGPPVLADPDDAGVTGAALHPRIVGLRRPAGRAAGAALRVRPSLRRCRRQHRGRARHLPLAVPALADAHRAVPDDRRHRAGRRHRGRGAVPGRCRRAVHGAPADRAVAGDPDAGAGRRIPLQRRRTRPGPRHAHDRGGRRCRAGRCRAG